MSSAVACYPTLDDRTVFITGGGSGIGAELVRAFHQQGCRVAFVDILEAESRSLVREFASPTPAASPNLKTAATHTPFFIPCDIADVSALQTAIAHVGEALGPISVLVNNAADDTRHSIEETTVELWDRGMAVNQRPMFFAVQAVVPQMRRLGGGSIINFGSISWKIGQGGMPAYSMAKASVHGLTRSLARDLGPLNIRVNTVVPGWVMTEKQLKQRITPEAASAIDAAQCLKTRVMPHDIAAMVMFLAADDSALCTAQEFTVDGGWT